jgi:5-methylthioadenosine/S-adenosylhomocysteine deaminase
MNLLRGYADDLPLMRWLQDKIWPAEGKYVSPQFVRDGTLLAAAEMLRGGVTCCSDMYFYPEAAAEAFLEAGMRAALGIVTLDFPTSYASDASDYLAKGLAARDRFRNEALLNFTLAPHAPYTVSDPTFERVATLSAQLSLPIHVHIHETKQEIEDSLKAHGVRPIARLERLGLVGPDLIAVHAVHLEPEEIALLSRNGSHIAHCPTSNMKLGSGICPVAAAIQQGVPVGLGTDGAASNNRLDMFSEMRQAALLGKAATLDPSVLDTHTVLRMATLNGAQALGLGDMIGSLLPGKQADLCAVKLDDWIMQPCFDAASHLVYVSGREQVSHVWVGGKLRVDNTQLAELEAFKLLGICRLWQNKLIS